MDSSSQFDTIKLEIVHCIYPGVIGFNFQKYIVFLSLKLVFVLATSTDTDEMPCYAVFDLGPYCLPKYLIRDFQYTKN